MSMMIGLLYAHFFRTKLAQAAAGGRQESDLGVRIMPLANVDI